MRCRDLGRSITSPQIFYYIYEFFIPLTVLQYWCARHLCEFLRRAPAQCLDAFYELSAGTVRSFIVTRSTSGVRRRSFHLRLRGHSSAIHISPPQPLKILNAPWQSISTYTDRPLSCVYLVFLVLWKAPISTLSYFLNHFLSVHLVVVVRPTICSDMV